jgi:hypothetical protein
MPSFLRMRTTRTPEEEGIGNADQREEETDGKGWLDKHSEFDILLCVSFQQKPLFQPVVIRTTSGREGVMKVQQISVFLENKSGRLAEVTDILAKNGINIRALSLADTVDFGILRLIVNDQEKTVNLLKDSGFTVSINEVVAVVVPDRSGGLASILNTLRGKGINVEYMYAIVQKNEGNAVLILRFDELEKAVTTLRSAGVRMLSGDEVQKL